MSDESTTGSTPQTVRYEMKMKIGVWACSSALDEGTAQDPQGGPLWLLPYLPQPSPQKALQDSQRRGTSLPPAHLLSIYVKVVTAACLLLGKSVTFKRTLGTLICWHGGKLHGSYQAGHGILFKAKHTMTLLSGLPPCQ